MQIHISPYLTQALDTLTQKELANTDCQNIQEPVAMSLKTLLLLVVVAISLHTATSSPTIRFETTLTKLQNIETILTQHCETTLRQL